VTALATPADDGAELEVLVVCYGLSSGGPAVGVWTRPFGLVAPSDPTFDCGPVELAGGGGGGLNNSWSATASPTCACFGRALTHDQRSNGVFFVGFDDGVLAAFHLERSLFRTGDGSVAWRPFAVTRPDRAAPNHALRSLAALPKAPGGGPESEEEGGGGRAASSVACFVVVCVTEAGRALALPEPPPPPPELQEAEPEPKLDLKPEPKPEAEGATAAAAAVAGPPFAHWQGAWTDAAAVLVDSARGDYLTVAAAATARLPPVSGGGGGGGEPGAVGAPEEGGGDEPAARKGGANEPNKAGATAEVLLTAGLDGEMRILRLDL